MASAAHTITIVVTFLMWRQLLAWKIATIRAGRTKITAVTTTRRYFSELVTDELTNLRQVINYHNDLYYVTSNPILSDEEFDALIQREQELLRQNPAEQTPRGVGTTIPSKGIRRFHTTPMLSLDNAFTSEQIQEWAERFINKQHDQVTILSEPKLDGVSLSLQYKRDNNDTDSTYHLAWASTRGDGQCGTDITPAVLEMGLPSQLSYSGHSIDSFEVRGEVMMPKNIFEEYNKNNNETTFSNARNAASGILQRIEDVNGLRQSLRFYAYDLCGFDHIITSSHEMRQTLETLGFTVPNPIALTTLVTPPDVTNLVSFHSDLQTHVTTLGMDGVVHKVTSLSFRQLLGSTSRAPKWAIAHKFPALSVMTTLLDMSIQVGRTGALTPVAHLQPVDINGVNVQRATLHNFGHLRTIFQSRNEVPIGTHVMVRRAGDVIPQVVNMVDTISTNITTEMISLAAPHHCPACHSPVIWEEAAAAVARCSGPPWMCQPRAVAALAHAFSRDALDIQGLSERKIEHLRNQSILVRPSDVFQLQNNTQLATLPGWGPTSIQNLQDITQQVATDGVTLGRFLYSLGIRFAGQRSSELIAGHYGTVEAWFQGMDQEIAFESLSTVKGIGPALMSSLQSFAKDEEMVRAARELAKVIRVIPEEISTTLITPTDGMPWSGWSVVFTGALPTMSRKEAQQLAKDLLGVVSTPTAVSKNTNLVVLGGKGGKKLTQAIDLGVEVMEAADFIKLVDEYRSKDEKDKI